MTGKKLLAHNVFFALKDRVPAARERLIAAGRKYLSGHPGTVFFALGTLAEALQRPVNDRQFDVALHIVFENQAAHDAYQEASRHHEFVKECKENWASVRVFDSEVDS